MEFFFFQNPNYDQVFLASEFLFFWTFLTFLNVVNMSLFIERCWFLLFSFEFRFCWKKPCKFSSFSGLNATTTWYLGWLQRSLESDQTFTPCLNGMGMNFMKYNQPYHANILPSKPGAQARYFHVLCIPGKLVLCNKTFMLKTLKDLSWIMEKSGHLYWMLKLKNT